MAAAVTLTSTQFEPRFGVDAALSSATKKEGAFYVVTDTGRIYYDVSSSSRIELASYSAGTGIGITASGTTKIISNAGVTGVKGANQTNFSTGQVSLSAANVGAATSDHTHGNITNAGAITSSATIANGDALVITDSSASGKLIKTSITFDGSTETKALTQKGTWVTFNNYSLGAATTGALGGIKVGYTSSGRNYAVQLDNQNAYVNVPWTDTAVNYVLGATTKAWLMGCSSTPTSTATARTAVGDTFVYLTTTAGQLSAKSYSINDGASTPAEKVSLVWNGTDNSLDFVFV